MVPTPIQWTCQHEKKCPNSPRDMVLRSIHCSSKRLQSKRAVLIVVQYTVHLIKIDRVLNQYVAIPQNSASATPSGSILGYYKNRSTIGLKDSRTERATVLGDCSDQLCDDKLGTNSRNQELGFMNQGQEVGIGSSQAFDIEPFTSSSSRAACY